MKIAILGYGKMGKAIQAYCEAETNHEVVFTLNSENQNSFLIDELKKADVAIDFSHPNAAVKNIVTCFKENIPIVSGTTGWLNNWKEVEKECKQLNGTFFYSSNFSIGVHLFWKLVTQAAQLAKHHDYDVSIEETHHIHKIDAPSGTAITTAEKVIAQMNQYESWQLSETKKEKILPITAIRKNEVPGTHIVTFANTIDEIEIKHQANSRLGFVKGAVKAAEYIKNKKGVYTMDDLLK